MDNPITKPSIQPLPYQSRRPKERAIGPAILTCGLIVLLVFLTAFECWEINRHAPGNHWTVDLRWLYPLITAVAAWLGFVHLKDLLSLRLKLAFLAVIILFAGVTVAADRLNLLVDYDLWLQRGMPDRWTMTPLSS